MKSELNFKWRKKVEVKNIITVLIEIKTRIL